MVEEYTLISYFMVNLTQYFMCIHYYCEMHIFFQQETVDTSLRAHFSFNQTTKIRRSRKLKTLMDDLQLR